MFGKKKKEKNKPISTREIPMVDISDFDPPQLISKFQLGEKDAEVLKQLSDECIKSGLIDDKDAFLDSEQSAEDFFHILEVANKAAKNEKDFHEEFYSEETESALRDIEHSQDDFLNPILAENDDYGHPIYGYDRYKNDLEYSKNDISYTDDEVYNCESRSFNDSETSINVELPDGRIIRGKKL